jgi:DNA-binding MarR family transcriptional regulator
MMQRHVIPTAVAPSSSGAPALELTMPQAHTLKTIRQRGQVSIKALASAMQVSAPSASAMVDRLVELGAVTREHSRLDRREVVVRVTPEGERTVDLIEGFILQSIAQLLEAIGPRHAEMWCEVHTRIREVLEAQHAVTENANSREKGGVL